VRNMRRWRSILLAVLGPGLLAALAPACKPLRQPLGSLAPFGGSSGAGGTLPPDSGTQASGPPEWGPCDPAVFRCFQDPKVPSSPSPASLFSGAGDPDPTQKPVVMYPLPGSMHPINLADITFQWRRAPGVAPMGQTLFRIRLQRGSDTFEFFAPCNHTSAVPPALDTECVYHLPLGAWLDLAQTSRGQALMVDVAGVDPNRAGSVAISDPMTISFSPEDVRGGFYYWSTSVQGTMRLLFGSGPRQPFIAAKSSSNPTMCSGCHTVSRSGSTIAFTMGDSPVAGVLRVAPTTNPDQPLFAPSLVHDSGTLALNRDGSRVLVSTASSLALRDTATGAQITEVAPAFLGPSVHGFHPEWSPDDKSIALTLSAAGASDYSVSTGAIGVLPYNDGAFGPVEVLVPTGTEFNFYPTWSPDGHWLAFSTAPTGPLQTSYIQSNARLRLVNRDTKVVYELRNASPPPARTATWPKFAPASQAGGLMFLTFNAKLDYGFYLPHNAGGSPQLWMTTIDVRKLQALTDDASSPPVWLSFQDVRERNYLGLWADRIDCRVEAGKSIGCADHELCDKGACAMVAP
jgi:Tol biopolymer transport system component